MQFKALNELQPPSVSGDQLEWITSSARVLNVRATYSFSSDHATHVACASSRRAGHLYGQHYPCAQWACASARALSCDLIEVGVPHMSCLLLPKVEIATAGTQSRGCWLQITEPRGNEYMMGVTPQIMSRAVLDPMARYMEANVSRPQEALQFFDLPSTGCDLRSALSGKFTPSVVLLTQVTRPGETWRAYLLRMEADRLRDEEKKALPAWTVRF